MSKKELFRKDFVPENYRILQWILSHYYAHPGHDSVTDNCWSDRRIKMNVGLFSGQLIQIPLNRDAGSPSLSLFGNVTTIITWPTYHTAI